MSRESNEFVAPVKLLVIGGCRSGKSRFAEQWVRERFQRRIFLATLQESADEEMKQRIALHRSSRGEGWQTVEEPVDLVGVMEKHASGTEVFLVDCLTLWLTNLLMEDLSDTEIEEQVRALCRAVQDLQVNVVLVANEVGLGIVPEAPLGRRFRDLAGWTNQQVAAVCHRVVMMAAGLPLHLKG